jgi:hypothetical protein
MVGSVECEPNLTQLIHPVFYQYNIWEDYAIITGQIQERSIDDVKNGPGPDDDCLLNPDLSKCKATCDENNNCQCPEGFIMNEDDNCRPDKPCPKGFAEHNDDETGKCYPIKNPQCPPGQHYDPNQKKCISDRPPCPAVQTVSSGGSTSGCPPCPKPENGIAKMCPPPIFCKKDERYDPVQKKCVPNCPSRSIYHLANLFT